MRIKLSTDRIPSRSFTRIGLLVGVPFSFLVGARALSWAAAQWKTWTDGETLTAADLNANFAALQNAITLGTSAERAGASCSALRSAGLTLSGAYWVLNPAAADAMQAGKPVLLFCNQETNGGGWALLQNSVLGPNTMDFWNIPYAARLGRRGRPSLDANFYDGSLYQTSAATYMDVIEDLRGASVIAFVATSDGINNTTMRFNNPMKTIGDDAVYSIHFAAGWSAPDYDGDTSALNCAATFSVTQHYGGCWTYNLGSDADTSGGDTTDTRVGPHVHKGAMMSLMLTADGPNSEYSRVRRISRFVKW